ALDNGRTFVMEGIHAGPEGRQQRVLAIDGLTGKVLWRTSLPREYRSADHVIDPEGTVLSVSRHTGGPEEYVLLDAASGEPLRPLREPPIALGPGGRYCLRDIRRLRHADRWSGWALVRGADDRMVAILGVDDQTVRVAGFDRSGNLLAWGNADGT